ncbi:hypothetical protein AB0L86_04885 [Micromonospora musae]|uniref:hypothetical protein n=1 Tax=Micromonospora musae TaxID=1894970 RepID=UPI00341B5618
MTVNLPPLTPEETERIAKAVAGIVMVSLGGVWVGTPERLAAMVGERLPDVAVTFGRITHAARALRSTYAIRLRFQGDTATLVARPIGGSA